MGLIANFILIIFLVIIILIALLHNKKVVKKDLNTCFKKCNQNCDDKHSAAYFDLCKKRCAIKCGN